MINEIGHILTILTVPLSIFAFSKHCHNITSEFICLILTQYLSILHSRLTPFIILILLFVIFFYNKTPTHSQHDEKAGDIKVRINTPIRDEISRIIDEQRQVIKDIKMRIITSSGEGKIEHQRDAQQIDDQETVHRQQIDVQEIDDQETVHKHQTVGQEIPHKHQRDENRLIFDLSRFITITQTTICIFLCDFNFWNPVFSKNDHFSVGLMDLGVGCFIFNTAVLSSKISRLKLLKNSMMMLALGFIRLGVVKIFQLDVNPNEYGYHWNFYFTLSIVTLLYLLIDVSNGYSKQSIKELKRTLFNSKETIKELMNKLFISKKTVKSSYITNNKQFIKKLKSILFNNKETVKSSYVTSNKETEKKNYITKNKNLFNFILGISILTLYEVNSNTVISVIFNNRRDTLFMMNKEGILSVVPFLGFFLVLNYLGTFILSSKISHIWIANSLIYLLARMKSSPSRRVCNIAYLSWILFIQTSFLSIFKFGCKKRPDLIGSLKMYRFTSQNMLELFLLSNILVLIFKMTFDTYKMGYIQGNTLNIVYLGINFILLPLFKQLQLKNKQKVL